MEEERKVKLKTLNPCIICKICGGYFISPTTVTECLHTFCKSCLVKHLVENNTCPECNIVIHQSHPLQYIKFDRTMQDIVYKLVPGLAESELAREKDFYHAKGMDFPKDVGKVLRPPGPCSAVIERNQTFTGDDWIEFHRADEPVYLHLVSNGIKSLQRPFVRVSGAATVQQLKRYISAALFDSESRADEIEILSHDKNPVGKEHNLFFLYLTTWRYHSHHSRPMMLYYRLKDVFANPLFVMVSPQHTTECE